MQNVTTAPPATATKLKRIKVTAPPAIVKPDDKPTIYVEGDVVMQYCTAKWQEEDAIEVQKALREEILEVGMDEMFTRNEVRPSDPVVTIRLQDQQGYVLRVQFTKAYSEITPEIAEQLCGELARRTNKKVDTNKYFEEVLGGRFDMGVFKGQDGRFDANKFEDYRLALEEVAKQHGDPNPLQAYKTCKPVEVFHTLRWFEFPKVWAQKLITKFVPNTTSIVTVTKNPNKPAK